MRTLLGTLAGLVSLASIAAGCSGEESPEQAVAAQPQPSVEVEQESVQQEVRQDAVQQQEVAQESEQQSQQQSQSQSQAHAQSEAEAEPGIGLPARLAQLPDCREHDLAVEASRLAELAPQDDAEDAEDSEDGGIEEFELPEGWEEREALIAAAEEAMAGWYARLQTLTLASSLVAVWSGSCTQLGLETTVQVDPLASLSTGDYSPWFQLQTGLPLAEPDATMQMQEYLYDGQVYGTVSGLGGWGGSPWHYPLDYDDGAIQQWLGVRPSRLSNYVQAGRLTPLERLRDQLGCALLEADGIVEAELEGEPVWLLTCDWVIESLLPFEGYYPDDYDREQVLFREVRIAISRDSGAPLLSEFEAASRNRDGGVNWASRRIVLTGWNAPVDLPRPQPLVEGEQFADLIEELRLRASAPERLVELARRWQSEQVDDSWTLEIQLASEGADGEYGPRLNERRSPDSLERTISEWEPHGESGLALRERGGLRWNRDGFQVSEPDADGEPVWSASTPEAHGFGGTTLEDVLAQRDWIELDLVHDLLELADPEVTHPQDGAANYFIWVESGVVAPGDAHFEQFAGLIERAYAQLRIGEIEVSRIESVGMSISLDAGRRQLEVYGIGAHVQSTAGAFYLSLALLSPTWAEDYR